MSRLFQKEMQDVYNDMCYYSEQQASGQKYDNQEWDLPEDADLYFSEKLYFNHLNSKIIDYLRDAKNELGIKVDLLLQVLIVDELSIPTKLFLTVIKKCEQLNLFTKKVKFLKQHISCVEKQQRLNEKQKKQDGQKRRV